MSEKFDEQSRKDFDEAWNNDDYQRIMSSVCKKFYGRLSPEEIDSCKMMAMIAFLKKYDISRKTKKTSYLHSCVRWECLNRIRKENNFHKRHVTNCIMDQNPHKNDDLSVELNEAISLLSDDRKELIKKKFFARDAIKSGSDKKKVKKALQNLKHSLL